MINFKTVISNDSIELNLMGRKRVFKKGEEVGENAYTKAYPQHFQRIGEIKGLNHFLADIEFIPDPIREFLDKEEDRKSSSKKYITTTKEEPIERVEDEIANAINEEITKTSELDDFDVKIETTED